MPNNQDIQTSGILNFKKMCKNVTISYSRSKSFYAVLISWKIHQRARRESKAHSTIFSSAPPVKKTQEKLHPPEKARMLRLTTAEKWKAEDLAKYMTDQWLVFQTKKEEVLLMT